MFAERRRISPASHRSAAVGSTIGGHTDGGRWSRAFPRDTGHRQPNTALAMHWSPLNVLLELAFGLGLILGLAFLAYTLRQTEKGPARLLARVLVGWVGLYVAALLVVSL